MKKEELPLGAILARTKRELFRVLRKRAELSSEIILTHEQFALLFAIYSHEDELVQQDLAVIFGKNKSSILRLIDSLEEKSLIKRAVDKDDRRKNKLMVTRDGEKVIAHYLSLESQLVGELQDGLKDSEIKCFYKVIETMHSHAAEL